MATKKAQEEQKMWEELEIKYDMFLTYRPELTVKLPNFRALFENTGK